MLSAPSPMDIRCSASKLLPAFMSEDSLASMSAETNLFSFSADELAACAAAFLQLRFMKGAVLFTRVEPGTHLHIVYEGRVGLAITSEEGRQLSFPHAMPGDLFGGIAALEGSRRAADATTALTDIAVHTLERSDFSKLWSERPTLAQIAQQDDA